MSKKSDYTSEEWQLLLDVPPAVGTAVMHAGRSGMGLPITTHLPPFEK